MALEEHSAEIEDLVRCGDYEPRRKTFSVLYSGYVFFGNCLLMRYSYKNGYYHVEFEGLGAVRQWPVELLN